MQERENGVLTNPQESQISRGVLEQNLDDTCIFNPNKRSHEYLSIHISFSHHDFGATPVRFQAFLAKMIHPGSTGCLHFIFGSEFLGRTIQRNHRSMEPFNHSQLEIIQTGLSLMNLHEPSSFCRKQLEHSTTLWCFEVIGFYPVFHFVFGKVLD